MWVQFSPFKPCDSAESGIAQRRTLRPDGHHQEDPRSFDRLPKDDSSSPEDGVFLRRFTDRRQGISEDALLGGKGANLADMTSIGLPVPAGFTITTDTCAAYYDVGGRFPAGLSDQIKSNIRKLEKESGKKFGSTTDPLLVSVRSGAAAVSMPGMMDTVLNLGLNDKSVIGLAELTGNERFAWDAYRRLINMYGDVVMGVDHHEFEAAFDRIKKNLGVTEDTDVPAEGLRDLCKAYKEVYRRHVGSAFPTDPFKQLELAVEAVFRSWNSDRANLLSTNQRDLRSQRHGGERSGDGLREHG